MKTLIETLLRTAAGRWPAAVREERAREWAAEVHHMACRWAGTWAAWEAMAPLLAAVPFGRR